MKPIEDDSISATIDAKASAFDRGDFELARLLAKSAYDFAKEKASIKNKRGEKYDASIIIVSYRCNDRTIELLKAADQWKLPFSFEVILVLNNDEALRMIINDVCQNIVVVDSPINLGASGGRNLGTELSSGEYLIFLDDDGWTDEDSLTALYDTCLQYSATGVRGRVLPRPTSPSAKPAHYEPGNVLSPSFMDIEGITIWNAKHFKEVGGFDILLFGHEGFELYSRLVRWHGPHSFIYTPDAVLLHDFSSEGKSEDVKKNRYKNNQDYLKYIGVDHQGILSSVNRYRNDPSERAVFISSLGFVKRRPENYSPLVSIITTAKDAGKFLREYTLAIKGQGYQNFEVVFVDDNSEDDTNDRIIELWKGDPRLKFFKCRGNGRAAALNTAVSNATGDICVIADADDLMVPARIDWSLSYFEQNPDSACMSFYIFNETSALRGTRPFVSSPTRIRLRSFVGMPVSFPGFAFRRESFELPFNEELEAGIDCDWLFRNLNAQPELDGHLVPIASSYYRLHDGQITAQRRDTQMEVGYSHVRDLHSRYIDFDEENDKDTLLKLMGWMPLSSGGDIQKIYNYTLRFIGASGDADFMREVREYMLVAVRELHISRLKSDYTNIKGRLDAERAVKMATLRVDKAAEAASKASAIAKNNSLSTDTSGEAAGDAAALEKIEDAWFSMSKSKAESTSILGRFLGKKAARIDPPQHFNEFAYLEMYPDVKEAVRRGDFHSGFHHFMVHGRTEGRARPLVE